jgi:hypothetical protein
LQKDTGSLALFKPKKPTRSISFHKDPEKQAVYSDNPFEIPVFNP